MLRPGLLAVLLTCSGTAFSAPQTPIAFDASEDIFAPLRSHPEPGPLLADIPLTWESLLNPTEDVPSEDICRTLRRSLGADPVPMPFAADDVISSLLSHGLCEDGSS